MDDKTLDDSGVVELSNQNGGTPPEDDKGNTSRDDAEMAYYGKRQQLKVRHRRNVLIPKLKTEKLSETSGSCLSLDLSAVSCPLGKGCLRRSFDALYGTTATDSF